MQISISAVASGSFDANEANRYRFAVLSGVDAYTANTAGEITLGVNQDKPRDNEHVGLAVMGLTKITLGASISAGVYLTTNATGFAVEAASGDYVPGVLLTGATSGAVGEMLMSFTGSAA